MNKKQKRALFRILCAAALFVLSFLAVRYLAPPFPFSLLMYLVPYLFIGYDVLFDALRGIFRGDLFDEKFLMSVATVGALIIGEYPEAVFVLLFFRVGELFESVAVHKSRNALKDLAKICPDTARVLNEKTGKAEECAIEDIPKGTLIRILPGDRIPLDAVVVSGSSALDTSALTGEALPKDVSVGESLHSGALNLTGVLVARTVCVAEEDTASRILALVEGATDRKAKIEGFITRFSRFYTPTVCILAVFVAVLPIFFGVPLKESAYNALSFLVISCPCALVISVPLSFFAGIGGAARRGILFKGSREMEALARTRAVFFDKTGTLTKGAFGVTDAVCVGTVEKAALLSLAAAAESQSTHPVARAIAAASPFESAPSEVTELAGRGVRAIIDGEAVLVGNAQLLEENGVPFQNHTEASGTAVFVAKGGELLGYILLSDTVKETASEAIEKLSALGVRRTAILSGDHRENALRVASTLGIGAVYAELLPSDKVDALLSERANIQGGVAYVGDGINDAPVLAASDAGIALGALGSDAAAYAADVVLTSPDPLGVPTAIAHARRTRRIVIENIVFALSVKVAVCILSALSLTGIGAAVFADVGVSVIAILNAMRSGRIA